MGVEADPVKQNLTVTMVVKTIEDDPMTDIRDALEALPGITHYRLN